MPAFEPILTKNFGHPRSFDIDVYESTGGWQAWKKALTEHQPDEITDMVKRAGLRGRGGAGFPAGLKWSFIPKGPGPKYLTCNADESEPGTFHDRVLMEKEPHTLLEGCAICSYAIGCHHAFIYCRGEYTLAAKRLNAAIKQATEKGYLGPNALGTGYEMKVTVYTGAGAYICGEETALLESLEGDRPMPRSRPPFPAVVGLYNRPTVINNCETLSNVPYIVKNGVEWYQTIGRNPNNWGPKIYSISGRVNKPGNYELPLGVAMKELIYEHAGGIIGGKKLKAVLPSGAAAPMIPAAAAEEAIMDFDSMPKAGTMLGSTAVIVLDEDVSIPHAVLNLLRFFNHESCGKCTPCREGTLWIVKTLERVCQGDGRPQDLDLLLSICDGIGGKVLCALGDFATQPIISSLKHFRPEYEALIKPGAFPVIPINPIMAADD